MIAVALLASTLAFVYTSTAAAGLLPLPVAGDWNHDAITNPGVFTNGAWELRNSNSGGAADLEFSFGDPDGLPVAGDWNRDANANPGVFTNGAWALRISNSGGPADLEFSFGDPDGLPVAGDWNGDGCDTVGVFTNGAWALRNSPSAGAADVEFSFGDPDGLPVAGDWDGDGVVTSGVFSNGVWALRNSNSGGAADLEFSFGRSAPLAKDDGPFAVPEGGTVSGNVLSNDTDANGDPLTAIKISDPANGTVSLAADGSFRYVHDHSDTTSDSFTYKANDGGLDSNVATVAITVTPVGDTVGLVNPTQGRWHLRNSAGVVTSFYFGNPGDVPVMGDWDGDGIATPGLFRTSDAFAYLSNANRSQIADIRFFFGNPSDIPLAGDWDGDGDDTLSIYRPSEQRFYIVNELGENEGGLGPADFSFLFGNPGDKPVAGDWDGDGIDEVGLHRESTGFFYWRNTLTTGVADGEMFFGDPGDRFIAGDWGIVDGKDTPAVFRPSDVTFYFRHTLTQGVADSQFTWTGAGTTWLPVAGTFGLG